MRLLRNRAAAEGLLQMEKEPGQAIIIINILLKAAEVYSKIMRQGAMILGASDWGSSCEPRALSPARGHGPRLIEGCQDA